MIRSHLMMTTMTFHSDASPGYLGGFEGFLGPSRGHGKNRSFRCPWHDDSSPSLSANIETGLWLCFGCDRRGNLDTLYRLFGETPDPEYRWDRAKGSLLLSGTRLQDLSYEAGLLEWDFRERSEDSTCAGFLRQRGISQETARSYQVGLVSDRETGHIEPLRQSLSFPYHDGQGICRGIKIRYPDGSKRAVSGSVFEGNLFGARHVQGKGVVVICEGESDTLKVADALKDTDVGVAGTSGASVNDSSWGVIGIQLLFAERIYLAYDADEAGDRCAGIATDVLGVERCTRLRPVHGKDITDHLLAGGTLSELGFEGHS